MLTAAARNVYNILTGTMLPEMSGEVIAEWPAAKAL